MAFSAVAIKEFHQNSFEDVAEFCNTYAIVILYVGKIKRTPNKTGQINE